MEHPAHYRGKKVIVLGLARSGQAVARCFHAHGARVIVNDIKERKQCPEADELEAQGIDVICGSHPPDLIDRDTALVVKNPGIPYRIPPVKQALESGIEVVTEVEVAWHLTDSPIIAVTGSNGKTTTTTWIGELFTQAGREVTVAGNIGTPLCEAVQNGHPDWIVAELSSFQLKGTRDFRPRISCLLNIVETHLDYHGTMEDYVDSKARLFANQTENDQVVYNWDDPACRRLVEPVRAEHVPFSMSESLPLGAYLLTDDRGVEWIAVRGENGKEERVVRVDELAVPGRHNVQNALAVAAVSIAAKVEMEPLREALRRFRGVEHRLELFLEKNGIRFFNNSKATNPAATEVALSAFEQPVVLIAGGMDRGADFTTLQSSLKNRVKALIALGETREMLARVAEKAGVPAVKRIEAETAEKAMEEAVQAAIAEAESGDVVLLSPCCASWDMFPSFEERGRMFKQYVHTLIT